jgi:nicotinamidase/pyrazinamidase
MSRPLFCDVDTQRDFIEADGRLAVPRAAAIVPRLGRLTAFAHARGIRVLATAEEHIPGDTELSEHPDFENTWPPHCMRGSRGQEKLAETALRDPVIVGLQRLDRAVVHQNLDAGTGDVLVLKRHFDVFTNPNMDAVLHALDPDVVVIYGVPLEIGVRHVVEGLLVRRPRTRLYVVTDAVKAVRYELGEHALRDWGDEGVRLVKTEEVVSEGMLDPWLIPH